MAKLRDASGFAGRVRGRLATGRGSLAQLRESGNAREIEKVRWFTRQLDLAGVRPFALAVNHLSNGLIYVLIGLLFYLAFGMSSAVVAAAAALLLGHLVYPVIKRHYRRRRPFRFDGTVPSLLPPLDDYSFPSGHMMSCVAVSIPLCIAVPAAVPVAIALFLVIGWARLVAGHHYPSDLAAGGLLGAIVAMPVIAAQLGF
ncbi:phosphatase PAP2 family protein [Aurantiacibacter poecillastricola]|uniref:phosphatase PAP2 family protein n=1 Tax=Aurantiacibacter poecillastricola TaxID=3064385 RepID=UPI00273F259B|nr:phosphatase PAP2 family protein [Aurantiacibacter sp. 219JJ12-13]MDP5261556.1 phosphatase PAP2 family protein [Aurantiacibacter sp. 219JJ12-13]